MSWRIEESEYKNEARYIVGIKDDGTPIGIPPKEFDLSVQTLLRISKKLNVNLEIENIGNGESPYSIIGEMKVNKMNERMNHIPDIHLAVVGNVDSGKSTLVGVLMNGNLDNGNGSARSYVFRFPHEIDTGRTSSIAKHIIGFNEKNEQIKGLHFGDNLNHVNKVITLVDLAGHEKYLKTTIQGLSGQNIDYSMVLVGGNMGVQRMTREHLGLLMAFHIPLFVVITKIDMCPPQILKETIANIKKLIKSKNINRVPYPVRDMESVKTAIEGMKSNTMVPLFKVSNVNGNGLDILLKFLSLLPVNEKWLKLEKEENPLITIDETYSVPGIGTVIGGNIVSGSIKVGTKIMIGPFGDGEFRESGIKTLYYLGNACESCYAGQSISVTIKPLKGEKLKRKDIHRGMVISGIKPEPEASYLFEANLSILHHPTTISHTYEPVIHVSTIKQTCQLVKMSQDVLRSGDKAICWFKFKYHPEYLTVGSPLIFREGTTRGIGTITKLLSKEYLKDINNMNEEKQIIEVSDNRRIANDRIKSEVLSEKHDLMEQNKITTSS